MNCLAKTLLPSISAARCVGPKTASPRLARSSAIPRVSGSSGPTTVRYLHLGGEVRQPLDLLRRQRHPVGDAGDPGIARRAVQLP